MIPLVPLALAGGLGFLGYKSYQAKKKTSIYIPPATTNIPPGYAPSAPGATSVGVTTPTYTVAAGDIPVLISGRFSLGLKDLQSANPSLKHKYTNAFGAGDLTPGMTINLPVTAKDNGSRQGATGVATGVAGGITSQFDIPGFSAGINTLLREAAGRGGSQDSLAATVSRIALQINYMSVFGDTKAGVTHRFGIDPTWFEPGHEGENYGYHMGTKNMSVIMPIGAIDHGANPEASGPVKDHADDKWKYASGREAVYNASTGRYF